MTVHELTPEQFAELKQAHLYVYAQDDAYAEHFQCDHHEPSYWDLAHADELVPDKEIFEYYGSTSFVPEDFSCSMPAAA